MPGAGPTANRQGYQPGPTGNQGSGTDTIRPPITPSGPPIEGFAIGNIAPDIVGEDIDGEPFRLSDYRGKVVVVDFWGDW